MPTVNAWQHIFSNVEQEQSPTGKGGFQTLFYTKNGLTRDEISEMEGHLLYFPSKTAEPVKRVFFCTTTGKGVIAQIVILDEPDQFGRKGRYLAHSIIVTLDDLASFEADPFRVFHQFPFISTVAEALKQGDFNTGDISALSLNLPDNYAQDVEQAKQWSTSELKKLTLLALRVKEQTKQREAITFSGDETGIENALEAAFFSVPTALRPHCVFDTYFYRCNLVATYYWAIGLPEPPVNIKFVLVNGQTRQIEGTAPTSPKTSYECWVFSLIQANNLTEIANNRDVAYAIAEWLDGRDYNLTTLNTASHQLITAVFKANPKPVQAHLQKRVGEHLPETLTNRVAHYIYEQTNTLDLYQQLRKGFELPHLGEMLYQSYQADGFREPSNKEIKDLEEFLIKNHHAVLRLFWAYWDNPRKKLPEELSKADEESYKQFSQTALKLKLIDPFALLRPNRGNIFLDLYLGPNVIDLLGLTKTLIEVEETACLIRITDRVHRLSRKELKKLAKLIDDQPAIPESFKTKVDKTIADLPPEKGIKGFLNSVWKRLPGKD